MLRFLDTRLEEMLGALLLALLDEFTRQRGGERVTHSDFLLLSAITLHNIPEGMAVAVPLIAGGMGRVRAVCVTALSGLPTVIGALLGYWLGSMGPLWHTLSLAFASGAMLYVVFGELLPESILMWRSKMPSFAAIIGIWAGIFIIFA